MFGLYIRSENRLSDTRLYGTDNNEKVLRQRWNNFIVKQQNLPESKEQIYRYYPLICFKDDELKISGRVISSPENEANYGPWIICVEIKPIYQFDQ